ncbi:MAG: hypothetical protein JJE25_05640 [Bacteroidia bacterium]|nr:hypothetical protein [Bacteroidia bacterium]
MKRIKFLFLILIFPSFLFAQKSSSDSAVSVTILAPSFAYQLPGGNMADRFGYNFNVGGSLVRKLKSNWLVGLEGHFLFGDQVREKHILDGISTQQGFVIGTNGGYADIFLYERGFHFLAKTGKIFNAFSPNPNSGIVATLGVGLLQHKIRIENDDNSAPQVAGEYVKGYDRLSNGLSITESIGWFYLGKNHIANFTFGFEFTQAFTKNRRSYNFDEMKRDDTNRLDLLYGFRMSWMIPFYGKATKEFYYN